MCQRCKEVEKLLQEWLNKQSHDNCWWYPEIFDAIIKLFNLKRIVSVDLPPRSEFREFCQKFEEELYKGVK